MSNFFYRNKRKRTRTFLFKTPRSNNSKSIFLQLVIASSLLVVSILLSTFLFNNLYILNLEQFLIEFFIHFKLTFSSLYLMLLNFFSIILILLIFLLAIFLNIASLFRIVKSIKYIITYKNKYNSFVARQGEKN